ncbi:Spt20 family-domain-containing protein [Melanogaster broomeanus]|nr:Spt20 family-domain-containing protein [Melanogaster broomeanus]
MTGYNITRSAEELLDSHEFDPPSFSIHLYPEYWTLNNGPKFLYNNPIASLLDDVRAHRIPVDYLELFESARVPFYNGCMLVELLDYRSKRTKDPPLEKPEKSRVTLHPSGETLWADLCLLNQRTGFKFTDPQVLELEAQLLLHTSPPLCLDPDPHLTRIANHTLRVSTPTVPVSLKRKSAVVTQEEDESEKARRSKIIQFANPRLNRAHVPSYRILDTLRRVREERQAEAQAALARAIANPPNHSNPVPTAPPTMSQPPPATTTQTLTPTPQTAAGVSKPRVQQSTFTITPENSRSTATPAPHPTVNQLQTQPPTRSPPVHTRSPAPTTSYQQVPASTPMAATSPAQRGYTQSPRPPSSQAPHSSPLASGSQLPTPDHRAASAVHFIQVTPQSKPSTPKLGYQPAAPVQQTAVQPVAQQVPQAPATPAQTQATHPTMNMQYYAQMQHLQRQAAQAQANQVQAQSGRATPQGASLPMVAAQGGPARSSPMVSNQPLATRSPMPNAMQLPVQMVQPTQHTMSAVPQAHFAQFRPINAQGNPHQQVVAHIPQNQQQNMGAPGQVTDGQHAMMMQYQMYGYGYGMAPGGRPTPYAAWAGMGRMPNQVHGQTPVMQPGLPQQMPVVQGKAAQAGGPTR